MKRGTFVSFSNVFYFQGLLHFTLYQQALSNHRQHSLYLRTSRQRNRSNGIFTQGNVLDSLQKLN
jgi:hypothetical protein